MNRYFLATGLANTIYFNYQISNKKILNDNNRFMNLKLSERIYKSAIPFTFGFLTVPYKILSYLYEPNEFIEKINKSVISYKDLKNYY
jgi:hypothetical protein